MCVRRANSLMLISGLLTWWCEVAVKRLHETDEKSHQELQREVAALRCGVPETCDSL